MSLQEPISPGRKLLVIVACAARPAQYIQDFIELVQRAGWSVLVVATPNAADFIDQPLLQKLTGRAVEMYPAPGSLALTHRPDAVVVVPATFNTLKKWAAGVTDTFALQLLASWDASRLPILAVPRASLELAQEPEFYPSLSTLEQRGVRVLYRPETYPPNNAVPWHVVLTTWRRLIGV